MRIVDGCVANEFRSSGTLAVEVSETAQHVEARESLGADAWLEGVLPTPSTSAAEYSITYSLTKAHRSLRTPDRSASANKCQACVTFAFFLPPGICRFWCGHLWKESDSRAIAPFNAPRPIFLRRQIRSRNQLWIHPTAKLRCT